MLLPTSAYSGDESPFVTALGSLDVPYLAGGMNFVVLTAAISGVNATLYAASRLLHDLAASGSAPKATVVMSRRGVPVGALVSIGGFFLAGVLLIYFTGAAHTFEVALAAAAVFILFGWIAIFVAHLGFRRQVEAGHVAPVGFRMPGSPYTDYACLGVLVLLFVSMVFDFRNPTWYYSLIAAVVLLVGHNLTYEIVKRNVVSHGLPPVKPTGTSRD
jgi:L-asparagine permease